MYACRKFPEKVENLALMAAGLCFDGDGGVLELWGARTTTTPNGSPIPSATFPAEFLDIGFALMDPVANNVTKYVRFYDNMDDEDFVENFARMERWLDEGIDMAGVAYEEFIRDIYQENKLYENELEAGRRTRRYHEYRHAVLQIVAEYDHLIPPEASNRSTTRSPRPTPRSSSSRRVTSGCPFPRGATRNSGRRSVTGSKPGRPTPTWNPEPETRNPRIT